MPGISFFQSLKDYIGFSEASSAALRDFRPIAAPHFGPIIDDFYATIEGHPGAHAVITQGSAQIERLKQTLLRWIDTLLLGPHDEAYFEMRARIGRAHVRIELPQAFMFTAMNRIRVRLLDVARRELLSDPDRLRRTAEALHQLLDMELAIMLETYREDLVTKNRAAERLATIGQFAAGIGHELRNPLGVIDSSLFLVRQQLKHLAVDDARVLKHLDKIAGEVKRSNKTIDDLLELARSRAPRRQPTDVSRLVGGVLETLAAPAGVQIVLEVPGGLLVDADPDQLHQVLVNLLTNSFQALGSGGGRITVGGERGERETRLRVSDDGPGVPTDIRHRIFEALFTTKAKGSGLGLALCRRIAEAHGGSIELETVASGARFVVRIPDRPATPAGEAAP